MSHCVVFIVMYDVQGDIAQCGDVYVLILFVVDSLFLVIFSQTTLIDHCD